MTKKRNETLEKFLPNSVLLIDKVINTTGFKKLLANHRQFAKFSIDLNKELNLILNWEQKVIAIRKEIKNKNQINENQDNKFRSSVVNESFIVFQKVHKYVSNGYTTFRLILSAIGTPMCNIATFLVPILKDLTSNECSVKDSFDFANELPQQICDCFMASVYITSLFTNIPLDETINICLNESLIKSNAFQILIEMVLTNFCDLLQERVTL